MVFPQYCNIGKSASLHEHRNIPTIFKCHIQDGYSDSVNFKCWQASCLIYGLQHINEVTWLIGIGTQQFQKKEKSALYALV